jgi:hypothetical protein
MFTFHTDIKVIGQLAYYILSIQNVFGLNVVSKHRSELPKCVKKSIKILLWIVSCHLNIVTVEFTGHVFIPNSFALMCKVLFP